MSRPSDPLALDPVVVTGVGLSSSLGPLAMAAAAFRAGLVRIRELPGVTFVTDDNVVEQASGHVAPGLNGGYQGAARLAHLARGALRDLGPVEGRVELALTVPDAARGYVDRHRQMLVDAVVREAGPDVRLAEVRFGRTGVAASLARARRALAGDASRVVVVGAVDSLVDPDRIEDLAAEDRLARPDQPDGLTPGESACFVRVERLSHARQRGADALARLDGADVADDVADDRVGIGLAVAVRRVLGGPDGQIAGGPLSLYVDVNGETERASALGHALVHLAATADVEPWRVVAPGPSFGDVGVAASPLAVGLAVRAAARGYAHGARAVVATTPDESGIASALSLAPL